MPSLPDPTTPGGPDTAAIPPTIDPDRFEDFEGFRETTLAVFTDPAANTTLRGLGDLLYTMALECCRYWPIEPEGSFYHQARAAVADLRHLQGYFAHLDRQREEASLSAHEERISEICGRLVPDLRTIADTLEASLGAMGAS